MLTIDATSLDAALAELEKRLDAGIRDALETSGASIADRAARERGINGGWQDRSGHLAASIRPLDVVGSLKTSMAIDIFAGLDGVFYAPYIHWGTTRGIRPRLFLSVALDREADDVITRLSTAVERAIKEAGL